MGASRLLGVVVVVVVVVVVMGVAGCDGTSSTEPSISGVVPSSGFAARSARIEISGDVVEWSSGATLSLGDGIAIDALAVASPTALFADITIAADAAPGLRDVTVRDGDRTLVLRRAFEVEHPIEVVVDGTLAQGSLAALTIVNRDVAHPFDTLHDGTTFTNTQLTGPAGAALQVQDVAPFAIRVLAAIDTTAVPGAITVTSGPPGRTLVWPGGTLDVMPRTAQPLGAAPLFATQTAPNASALYELVPGTAPAAVLVEVATDNDDVDSRLAILPANGRYADRLAVTSSYRAIHTTTHAKLYAIYLDLSGTTAYSYRVTARGAALSAPVTETAAANDTGAAAQPLSWPGYLAGATLSALTDVDIVKLDVPPSAIGKRVRVLTDGDPLTDVACEVFTNAALTASLGGPSDDADFQESWLTPPVPAGTQTLYIKLAASQSGFYNTAHKSYAAAIWLE